MRHGILRIVGAWALGFAGALVRPGAAAEPFPGTGTPASLRLAIEDLIATHGERYPGGPAFLERLKTLEAHANPAAFEKLKREALLANPLLDFDRLLLVRRRGADGLPANWQGNSSLKPGGADDELAILSPLDQGALTTLYRPAKPSFVGDVDLHFTAERLLFSARDEAGTWAVYEIGTDGRGRRRVSPDLGADVDSYEAIYLPDDRILFHCSSGYDGVPCVGGSDYVANLHIMNPDGTGVRRLCFDQDNNWNPVLLPNGRVLYLRWEYTDTAHYFSRVLMHMNPDGTDQKAFYGSNSYWPNALFYARPIPGSASQFAGIVSGHHGTRRAGGLFLFDAARGRTEADGVIQQVPGRAKKVEPIVLDDLASIYRPHFLHPYPLSDKYFLVACNLGGWGLWLVDVFDNMVLLKKDPGAMLFEPIPLRPTPRPPVLPDRVRPDAKEATVMISDIYEGPGLAGVPRGTVKALRVFRYEYSPRNHGGHYAMGIESGWDVKSVLGTVPVEADGSALFQIPANTPVSVQPLDQDGKALQLMRSWLVGMPGETLSCVGCHESQNSAPPSRAALAARRAPRRLEPWRGPARGFSFVREIQPVLDRFCAGCHDGRPAAGRFAVADRVRGTGPHEGKKFSEQGIPDLSTPRDAYFHLHPFVRRNGPEGDYHLLTPLEFHADTSELIQMLRKGHHGVALDAEAWDRLYTWIDLNAPWYGTWGEAGANPRTLARRLALRKQVAGVDTDAEGIVNPYVKTQAFVMPTPPARAPQEPVRVDGWPFDAAEARRRQGATPSGEIRVDGGEAIKLVRIPAGAFSLGRDDETPQERPVAPAKIEKPFWMGATEITLAQYRQFDPAYENGVYDMHWKDQVNRGYFMNDPAFPAIRISWDQAMAYCAWLSKKTGRKVSLPTEAQWEWACRAGTDSLLSYGGLDDDFSPYANLADAKRIEMAVSGVNPLPIERPDKRMDYELKDPRFHDGVLHLAKAGTFKPNAWGLYDMHGNAAEWTRSLYRPYPWAHDGRDDVSAPGPRTLRGGSWNDRPHRATSSYRLSFPAWQRVYHAGFRIVVED